MKMRRKRIEVAATYLAVTLLVILTVITTLMVSDNVFRWDLFPRFWEKLGVVMMTALVLTMVSAILVSIMLNVSIIADRLSEHVNRAIERDD